LKGDRLTEAKVDRKYLKRRIGWLAYQAVVDCGDNPHAFIEQNDLENDLWELAIKKEREYDSLPQKTANRKTWVSRCLDMHIKRRPWKRKERAGMQEESLRKHFQGTYPKRAENQESIVKPVDMAVDEKAPNKPIYDNHLNLVEGNRSFKNVKKVMGFYVQYRSTDYMPHSPNWMHSYDDEIVIAMDIERILDGEAIFVRRPYTEWEKMILLSVGVYGVEPTIQRMDCEVGNARRVVTGLVRRMKAHLTKAGYLRIKNRKGARKVA
jgi:hypothetical protein